jgi:hypothetical protein
MRDFDNTGFAVAGAKGPTSRLMKKALEFAVRAECGECGRRIDLDDRDVRHVGARYMVFHRRCAQSGSIRARGELLALRTPSKLAEVRRLAALIDREKARRV